MSGHKHSNDSPIRFYGVCAYPNCRVKTIDPNKPFVSWIGAKVSIEEVDRQLSPIGKLAESANRPKRVEENNYYCFSIELHTECAAEWAMHLTTDALKVDYNLGSKLRG